jgi:hypothetical protein
MVVSSACMIVASMIEQVIRNGEAAGLAVITI